MLAVVSAVVAFDRWPGSNLQTKVQTLVLDDKAPAIRVSATATGRSATALTRAGGSAAPGRATPTGGGVGGQRVSAGRPAPGGGIVPAVPAPQAAPLVPKAPDVPTPDNIVNSLSNPGTTAGQIADGTQSLTDTAGRSLTTLSPDVGGTVTQAGQTVAETVRGMPLPDHVVPGH